MYKREKGYFGLKNGCAKDYETYLGKESVQDEDHNISHIDTDLCGFAVAAAADNTTKQVSLIVSFF